jgi:diguanylate cyclase (GGDEF)-like protein
VLEGGLIIDSARLRQAERAHLAELTYRAFHDSLTGLPNRARLFQRLEGCAESTLMLVDLDGFKQVNDTLGHHAGDALLRSVGERLVGAVDAEDLVARLGGDEFAVLVHVEKTAREKASRIDEALRRPFSIEGKTVEISASIGVASGPDPLRRADAAMYASKRSGDGPRGDLT